MSEGLRRRAADRTRDLNAAFETRGAALVKIVRSASESAGGRPMTATRTLTPPSSAIRLVERYRDNVGRTTKEPSPLTGPASGRNSP
jgi:hypothetical protein